MKVSIIIVTNSQKTLLDQCLAQLDASTRDFKGMEVIVVDNASPHPKFIQNLCIRYDHKYIRTSKNLSFSYANKLGIDMAEGKWLLLLNDDTVPLYDEWLNKLYDFAKKHKKAGVVGCKLLYPHDRKIQHCGVVFNQDRQPYHKLLKADHNDPRTMQAQQFQAVTFACVLINKKVYDEVGGFTHIDQKPAYHYEDIDFCFKARKAGYEVWYCPEAKVLHYSAQSYSAIHKTKADNYKFLPAFKKKWFIEIDNDDWETTDLPPNNPHIVIGIPLSDGSRWHFKHLMRMVDGFDYWKKQITILFGVDNCSQDFYDDISTWSQLNKHKYKAILLPQQRTYTEGKVKSVITNRNNIREKAIEIGADYIFFIDSDVSMERDTLPRLIKMCEFDGADIAAGVYFYKSRPKYKPMLFQPTQPTEKFKKLGLKKKISTSSYPKERVIGLGNFRIASDLMDGKIHQAGACHMGCTLIKINCLKEIDFRQEDCYGTEDLSWFSRAMLKGYKLLVDTGMKLFHLDADGYVYCWWNMPLKQDNYIYQLQPVKEKIK